MIMITNENPKAAPVADRTGQKACAVDVEFQLNYEDMPIKSAAITAEEGSAIAGLLKGLSNIQSYCARDAEDEAINGSYVRELPIYQLDAEVQGKIRDILAGNEGALEIVGFGISCRILLDFDRAGSNYYVAYVFKNPADF